MVFQLFRDGRAYRHAISVIRGAKSAHAAVPLLSGSPVGALAAVAASREEWWVRAAAIEALRGRADAAACDVLLEIVRDIEAVEELRVRAVQTLVVAEPPGLVYVLRDVATEARTARVYDLDAIVVLARATLGDVDVSLALLRLVYGRPSVHTRPSHAALAALESRAGHDALARGFGAEHASVAMLARLAVSHPEPEVRRWAIASAPLDADFIVPALADEPLVVEGAFARVIEAPAHVATLAVLASSEATPITRAWAALALHRLGHREEARVAWAALREPALVDLPLAVRRAVLFHYLPGLRPTDPRHVLEAELDHGLSYGGDHDEGPDEPFTRIYAAAREALLEEGILLDEPEAIGDIRNQGSGTYYEAEAEGRVLCLSSLGRFVRADDGISYAARAALERAGFLFIEGALADETYTGLMAYDFGAIREKTVSELLFDWVD